jgi:hypothetical protein
MAINADQLLNRPSELHRRYGGRLAMQKAQQEKMVGGGPSNIVLSKKSIKGIEGIKINVIKIEDILKGSLALDKKQLDDKKKATSRKRKEDIETKLETKPNVESGGKVKLPAAPRMGILDFVKNFIGNVLLGYFAVRLIKHLPKIMPIVKFLGNAADFIINTGGKLLNGLLTFAQKGQEAHDKTRGFIKNLGGENFAKGFDKFIGAIDTALFLTTVLAGSMAMEAMSGDGGGGPGGPGPRRQPTRTTSGGRTLDTPNIRNPLRQKPTVTTGGATPRPMSGGPKITGDVSGGGKFKLPSGGSIRSGGIAALVMLIPDIINSGMLVSQGRPKDGIRTFLSAIAGVGAGMAAMAGITAGAAALGITGVGIPAAIALAITGFAASSAASFLAYEGTNAILKKMGLFDNDPKTGKPYAYRSGGITRGGRSRGRVKRTLSKGKYKRVLAPQKPLKTELKTEAFTKNKNLKESTEELDKTKYFGPILAISSKIMNKEEPTDRDYQNVGLGINLLIAKGIQDGQLKGGIVAKFAGGGLVDPDVLSAAETGGDISNWVAKTFRGAIETGAQRTMREMKEMREIEEKKLLPPISGGPAGSSYATASSGEYGDILDLIASVEAAGGYDVVNRGKIPGLSAMTIAGARKAAMGTGGSGAMGRYQQMPQYVLTRAKSIGLNPDTDLFSPENQDKLAILLINGAGYKDWKAGKLTTEKFAYRLAGTWRGLPEGPSNLTYQDQYASGNKAHTTWDKVMGVLSGSKTSGSVASGQYSAGPMGKPIPSTGVINDREWNTGIPLSTLSTKSGKSFQVASAVSGQFKGFISDLESTGYKIKSIGGYRKAGTGGGTGPADPDYDKERYSHPYGGSIDINPNQNPYGKSLATDMPSNISEIAAKNGLGWGGNWSSVKDAMHFSAVKREGGNRDFSFFKKFSKGGRVPKLTFAMLGERGPEFVFDADTTAGLDRLAPQLLEKLNIAKTKPQLASILQSYAPYDANASSQTIVVQSPSAPSGGRNNNSSGGGVAVIPIPVDNFTEILAMIG